MILAENVFTHLEHNKNCSHCTDFHHDQLNEKESVFLCHIYSQQFIEIPFLCNSASFNDRKIAK